MASITLKNISKIFENGIVGVKDFNLEIKDKDFVVLVGPSGCGKSTTLRMIAGLEEITSGDILIDGKIVNDLSPKDRDIAMVFQNYALYPHMTVYENMSFGLKLRKFSKTEIEKRVKDASEILELENLLNRKPKALSGGQRQRVALGRAIVRKPKVFLFDEPLSNLDAKLRVQMRSEITKLHRRLDATIVYVTHDQVEAMTMGTKIVVMKDGIILQVDKPIKLYEKPLTKFVGEFIGSPSMNFIEGKVSSIGKTNIFSDKKKTFKIKLKPTLNEKINKSTETFIGIRPENISLNPKSYKNNLKLNGTIDVIELLGNEQIIYVSSPGDIHFVFRTSTIKSDLKIGDSAVFYFDLNKIHLFKKETNQSLF
ncbi:MAG: sn-glycerol-3-phosphate ABC transporter ATP-binding protein UgpC [Bacteroidota bacterium]